MSKPRFPQKPPVCPEHGVCTDWYTETPYIETIEYSDSGYSAGSLREAGPSATYCGHQTIIEGKLTSQIITCRKSVMVPGRAKATAK